MLGGEKESVFEKSHCDFTKMSQMILFCNLPLPLTHTLKHISDFKSFVSLLYSQVCIKYIYHEVLGIMLITSDMNIKKIEQSLPSQSFLLYTAHRNKYKSLHTIHFS